MPRGETVPHYASLHAGYEKFHLTISNSPSRSRNAGASELCVSRPERGADGAPRGAPGVEQRAMTSGTPTLARRWHPSRRRDGQPLGAPTVAVFTRGPAHAQLRIDPKLLAGSAPPGCLAAVASGPRDVVTNRSPRDAKPAPPMGSSPEDAPR